MNLFNWCENRINLLLENCGNCLDEVDKCIFFVWVNMWVLDLIKKRVKI